jgi:effector-binding domain-containing protein
MDYQVCLTRIEAQPTAVVRLRAKVEELPRVLPAACGEVWQFIRSPGLPKPGHNIALYLNCEMDIEAGVEVNGPFAGNGSVVCSSLPGGLVATTAHFGPYNQLGMAYTALEDWCSRNGHKKAGPCWEVYGHWDDDPAKLRTDVFFLLRDSGAKAE